MEIEIICQKVRETTILNGPCLYKWDDDENCLNILYVAKRIASCFYQENKIRITGLNNNFSDLIEDIFSREYEQKVKIENLRFEKNENDLFKLQR